MIAAASKSLRQLFSRPFRSILLKSLGMTIALLVVLIVVIEIVFGAFVVLPGWVETTIQVVGGLGPALGAIGDQLVIPHPGGDHPAVAEAADADGQRGVPGAVPLHAVAQPVEVDRGIQQQHPRPVPLAQRAVHHRVWTGCRDQAVDLGERPLHRVPVGLGDVGLGHPVDRHQRRVLLGAPRQQQLGLHTVLVQECEQLLTLLDVASKVGFGVEDERGCGDAMGTGERKILRKPPMSSPSM